VAKTKKKDTVKGPGLSFDTLSRIGAQFGVPVLAGISERSVEDLPINTIFMSVTDQHWLLGLKGEHKTLIFDSLGLPPTALQHICHGASIMPWNRFGYQSMFSTVCGYYLICLIISLQHGELIHNADIDRVFAHICPYRVPRPDNMTEWYALHRSYNAELIQNDKSVMEYVAHTYPHLAWIDQHAPHLQRGEVSSATLGSPLYAHAGIHAPTVHQRYGNIALTMNNDAQRAWPGMGEALISSMPDRPQVVNGSRLAYATAINTAANRLEMAENQLRQDRRRHFHVAGPDLRRPLTRNERVLWARAASNFANPPSGLVANAAAVAPPDRAENAQDPVPPPPPIGRGFPEEELPPRRDPTPERVGARPRRPRQPPTEAPEPAAPRARWYKEQVEIARKKRADRERQEQLEARAAEQKAKHAEHIVREAHENKARQMLDRMRQEREPTPTLAERQAQLQALLPSDEELLARRRRKVARQVALSADRLELDLRHLTPEQRAEMEREEEEAINEIEMAQINNYVRTHRRRGDDMKGHDACDCQE
jgi:hypothetical protein